MSLSHSAKQTAPNGPLMRAAKALPVISAVISAVIRDTGRDVNMVFYYLVIALALLVLAVQVWGLAALVLTALALVPVMFALIIWITLP